MNVPETVQYCCDEHSREAHTEMFWTQSWIWYNKKAVGLHIKNKNTKYLIGYQMGAHSLSNIHPVYRMRQGSGRKSSLWLRNWRRYHNQGSRFTVYLGKMWWNLDYLIWRRKTQIFSFKGKKKPGFPPLKGKNAGNCVSHCRLAEF